MSTTDATDLDVLLEFVHKVRGFDFSAYKRATLERRLGKRLEATDCAGYRDYIEFLEVNPGEFDALFDAMFINVTAFYRDTASWSYLEEEIVPELLHSAAGRPLRVWSAGCASGQETYSLAMVLCKALGEKEFLSRVKIYATDVDDDALAQARAATYSENELGPVPEEDRERFFVEDDGSYRFRDDLRRTVIFGRNDLARDAPISRIDLLCCRNTLIYFNAETQSRILRRLHFALADTGRLFLGKSEMLIAHGDLFEPVNIKRRVFTKVPRTLRDRLLDEVTPDGADRATGDLAIREAAFDAGPEAQIVLDNDDVLVLANACARERFRVAPTDIGRPVSELEIGFRPLDLVVHAQGARDHASDVEVSDVSHTHNGDEHHLDVRFAPIAVGQGMLGVNVVFVDVTARRGLQLDLEASTRELENAYEELQATVEELETTNEELQSTNEELETINEELRRRSVALDEASALQDTILTSLGLAVVVVDTQGTVMVWNRGFMEMILAARGIAVVAVDADLRVRLWNSHAEELWGVRPHEAEGHLLADLDVGLAFEHLEDPVRALVAGISDREDLRLEAHDRRGRAFACVITVLPMAGRERAAGAMVLLERDPATS